MKDNSIISKLTVAGAMYSRQWGTFWTSSNLNVHSFHKEQQKMECTMNYELKSNITCLYSKSCDFGVSPFGPHFILKTVPISKRSGNGGNVPMRRGLPIARLEIRRCQDKT